MNLIYLCELKFVKNQIKIIKDIFIRYLSVSRQQKWYRFAAAVPLAGILLFAEGVVLLVHGLRLGLEPIPFYVDTAFCLATGAGIWLLRDAAREEQNRTTKNAEGEIRK